MASGNRLLQIAPATSGPLSLTDSEQFAAAFEFAPIGMALLDLQSTSLRVNHAMAQMFGYSQGELVGVPSAHIGHPDDLAEDFRLRVLMLSGAFPGRSIRRAANARSVWKPWRRSTGRGNTRWTLPR